MYQDAEFYRQQTAPCRCFSFGEHLHTSCHGKLKWYDPREMEYRIESTVHRAIQFQLQYALKNIVGGGNGRDKPKQLTQGDKKMNIVTYAKLNKNQRTLYKVGMVDTDGHLTTDGRNVLLDMLAADPATQTKLVELAKDYKKDQKEE